MAIKKINFKLIRGFSLVTLFLATFSVLSVGFSSWVLVLESQNASETLDLDLDVGHVIDTKGILTFPEFDTTLPAIGPDGFVIDDGVIYKYLNIEMPLEIKIINGIDYYLADTSTFTLSLKLFKKGTFPLQNYFSSASYTYSPAPSGGESFNANSEMFSEVIYTTVIFTMADLSKYEDNESLSMVIKYRFDFSAVDFETTIYNLFNSETPPTVGFTIQASIEV